MTEPLVPRHRTGRRRVTSVTDEQFVTPREPVRHWHWSGDVRDEDGLPLGPIRFRRLWAGGAATAAVTALTAAIGVLLVRGLLHTKVFSPGHPGTPDHLSTGMLALWAAVATLVATGLLNLLLLYIPRPLRYFGCLVGLVTVLIALTPFTGSAPQSVRVATAVIYLVLGLEIWLLLLGVARASTLRVVPIDVPPTAFPSEPL